jgi:hypothetical protein
VVSSSADMTRAGDDSAGRDCSAEKNSLALVPT